MWNSSYRYRIDPMYSDDNRYFVHLPLGQTFTNKEEAEKVYTELYNRMTAFVGNNIWQDKIIKEPTDFDDGVLGHGIEFEVYIQSAGMMKGYYLIQLLDCR